MSGPPMTVEFKVNFGGQRPAPKPAPAAKAERQLLDRAARRARNLALAHHIDSLIRSGEVEDLSAMARMCGVSRARISKVVGLLGMAGAEQERLINSSRLNRPPSVPP